MDLYTGDEYRATKDWPYSIGAGCVVFREGDTGVEVLLLVRDSAKQDWVVNQGLDKTYHIPKGHAKVSETLQQSAERETEEEAGVKVRLKTYLGSQTTDFVHPKAQLHNVKTVHYFAAEWVSDLAGGDHEHSDKQWISVDTAEKLLGEPNPKGEDEILCRFKRYLELMRVEKSE